MIKKIKAMSNPSQINEQQESLGKSILSENGTIKYDFMISLENMVMAKIISSLWMSQNTQQEIVNLFHSSKKSDRRDFILQWPKIENNVIIRVSDLILAHSVTKKLTDIVPFLGDDMLKWINYQDKFILETDECSEYSAINYINNIKWTTRGKIDYAQTAKRILAHPDSGLSDDHKYKLACTYCLEDEIAVLAPNVVNQDYLRSVTMDIHTMVYFWTACVTGDDTLLYNPYYDSIFNYSFDSNLNINEKVFLLLTENDNIVKTTCNEVAIKYMWCKLNDQEKAKNIIVLVKKLANQDLKYSLVSNLDYNQQQEVFKKCSGVMLIEMLRDWLWAEDFLPTAFHVLNLIDSISYLDILIEVIIEKIKNDIEENKFGYNQYKSIFKQLWQNGSKDLKDFIIEHRGGYSLHEIVISLSWDRDMDVIEIIFNDLNTQQKENLVFRNNGPTQCAHFIQNDRWDLLELFIKYTHFSDENISQLKRWLIIYEGHEIAKYFLGRGKLDKIEHFMSWALIIEEEIDEFRQGLAYIKCISASNNFNHKINFMELENHFKWCAKGNLEVINKFKTGIPTFYFRIGYIWEILDDQYKLLDQVLNWSFSNNQQQISQFKSNMYKDDYLSHSVRSLTHSLMQDDNSFKSLEKFIDWSFIDTLEAEKFKTWLLYPQERSCSVCTYILQDYQFELAENFIKWCVTSTEEVSMFKNAFMCSDDIKYILDPECEDFQDNLQLLIKWLNPSKETAEKLKMFYQEWPDNFYTILGEYATR